MFLCLNKLNLIASAEKKGKLNKYPKASRR